MLAVDTNILVYAEGFGEARKVATAKLFVRAALDTDLIVPVQVLAELYRVLVRKVGLAPDEARERLNRYEDAAVLAPTLPSTLSSATELAGQARMQIFDAIILAAAAESECRLLVSEDMQDGFVWKGVTLANPFRPTLHPLLADALRT